MASRIDEELEQAKAAQRSMSRKFGDYRAGANLSRDGSAKKPSAAGSGTRERPLVGKEKAQSAGRSDKDASAARQNMQGIQIGRTPGTGLPSSDAHITGQVGGRAQPVRQKDWSDPESGGAPQKGTAITKLTRLAVPVVRPLRAETASGVTSFHFSHEAISKTLSERTSDSGTKNRPGSARDHSRYLERDSALATTDNETLEKIENDLQKLAADDPELAGQTDAQAIAKALGIAATGSVYIERQEAIAYEANGVAVLYSNIDEDPAERRRFWSLVEEHEKQPGQDAMRVRMDAQFDLWARVLADPACPEKVQEVLSKADPALEVRIPSENNEAMRRLMSKHGWRPRKRKKAGETPEEAEVREQLDDKRDGIIFEDARGGRVQYRIIGELPHEVSHAARVKILRGFAQEFEKRNLPYMAVMHAPDHTNNDKNWHFHLVYHDRPAHRFVNDPNHSSNDCLRPNEKDSAQTAAMKAEALAAIGKPELSEHEGKWAFEVPLAKRMKHSGNIRIRYPFAQEKSREPTRRPFLPMLRNRLADLTNEELEAAGHRRRLDPRRYSEMGIDRTPDVHLGTKASQHEQLGIPTERGEQNERNQWHYVLGTIQRQQQMEEQKLRGDVAQMRHGLAALKPDLAQHDRAETVIIAFEQTSRAATEHEVIARNLEEHYERAASRARRLELTCQKHLRAIGEKKASKRTRAHEQEYRAKLAEAQEHLAGLKALMADELAQIAVSRDARARLLAEAETHRESYQAITNQLREQRGATNDNQALPVAANDRGSADERLASGTEADGAITRKQMDAFVETVMRENIRLVLRNRVIVPKQVDPRFEPIIAAPNYPSLMKRLGAIHKQQNEAIADTVEAINADPSLIRAGRRASGEPAPVLGHPDKRLQAAFSAFGDEKRITDAVTAAMRSTGLRIDSDATPIRAGEPVAEPASPAKPLPPAAKDGARLLSLVTRRVLSAVELQTVEGQARARLEPAAAARLGLPELFDIDAESAAKVRRALSASQAEFARLSAFVRAAPGSVALSDGIALAPSAPADLKAIAKRHSLDAERVEAYREVRSDAAEQNAARRAEEAKAQEAQQANAPPVEVQKPVTPDQRKDEVALGDALTPTDKVAPTLAATPVAVPSDRTDAPANDASRARSDVATSTPRQDKPAINGNEPADDRAAPTKDAATGAAKNASKDTGDTFDLSRPQDSAGALKPWTGPVPVAKPEEAAGKAQEAKPEQRLGVRKSRSVSALEAALEAKRNQQRRAAEKSPSQPGAGTAKPVEQEPTRQGAKDGLTPAQALRQTDLFDLDAERERVRLAKLGGRGGTALQLRPGLHPLLDEYLAARLAGDEARRHIAAENIRANRQAQQLAKQLTEEEQGRIRADARARRLAAQTDATPRSRNTPGKTTQSGEDLERMR